MQIEKYQNVINVDINIWDDFDDNENKIYQDKTYITYAYIESSSTTESGVAEKSLSNNESLSILQFLKDKLVSSKIITDEDLFIHYFIAGNNLKGIIPFSNFFKGLVNVNNKTKSFFHYQRYELCFKNLTHEKLDNKVLPFLQSSKLDFLNCKNGKNYQLNIYSES